MTLKVGLLKYIDRLVLNQANAQMECQKFVTTGAPVAQKL